MELVIYLYTKESRYGFCIKGNSIVIGMHDTLEGILSSIEDELGRYSGWEDPPALKFLRYKVGHYPDITGQIDVDAHPLSDEEFGYAVDEISLFVDS